MALFHDTAFGADNHGPYVRVFADAAARAADIGPWQPHQSLAGGSNPVRALQLDTAAEYYLSDHAPVTWLGVTASFAAHGGSHENGGGDEISVAGLSGDLADDQKADRIRTTTGPTLLAVGAVADGQVLRRSGATIVGSEHSLRQSLFVDLASDATTTAAGFPGSTLLTTSIVITAGGILLINFTCGNSNAGNNNSNRFRLSVDGVARRAAAVRHGTADLADVVAIVSRVAGLAAGARTVEIQWYTNGGTGQVRPVTNPDGEHASMVIQEVTV